MIIASPGVRCRFSSLINCSPAGLHLDRADFDHTVGVRDASFGSSALFVGRHQPVSG
jgi:hypothetical protein